MREALLAMNALVERGVIENYAIGGAIGAAFYIEAVQTEDVDAFVFLPPSASGLLDLSPIYSELVRLGGRIERGYVRFGDWPLQVLPDASPLIAEAIRDAIDTRYEDVTTRVFAPEHLCCIALQTGRAKDILRVRMFLEQGQVNRAELERRARDHGLAEQMRKVDAMFL